MSGNGNRNKNYSPKKNAEYSSIGTENRHFALQNILVTDILFDICQNIHEYWLRSSCPHFYIYRGRIAVNNYL